MIRELTQPEGRRLLDKLTQRHFNMSAEEFIQAWEDGKFTDEDAHSELVRLVMLIPLAV